MKKYLIFISATMFSIAASAQALGTAKAANIERMKAEQYQTAEPVDVVVTAKRPVAKKDAAPRKSKVSANQKTATSTKTSTK